MTTIINENYSLMHFVTYLFNHSYPRESVVSEWEIGKHHYADLAIIDIDSGRIIALFELKKSIEGNKLKAATQLKCYLKELNDESIPSYVVLFESESNFKLYRLNIKDEENLLKK